MVLIYGVHIAGRMTSSYIRNILHIMSEYVHSIITQNVIVEVSTFCTRRNFATSEYVVSPKILEVPSYAQLLRPCNFVAPPSIKVLIVSLDNTSITSSFCA